jgi:hypothetical protein
VATPRKELVEAYERFRHTPFPQGSSDEAAAQLHAELVLFDADMRGLIDQALAPSPHCPRRPDPARRMSKRLARRLTAILLLFSVSLSDPLLASSRQCPQPVDSMMPGRSGSRTIELPIDLPAVRQLQKAYENGHQPWRGDPAWVAAVAVTEALGTAEPAATLVSTLVVECESPSESIVVGKDASHEYRVYLKRLLPSQKGRSSIWTAVRVSVALLN